MIMEIQVIKVKGCKVMKKMANKQFKMLCADYNKVYKIIDTLKEMLDSGDYTKGTIDELTKRLRQADEYKEQYMISPLLAIRLEHMSNLVVYLREMKIEVDKIDEEISAIIDRIANIEELEELNFYE